MKETNLEEDEIMTKGREGWRLLPSSFSSSSESVRLLITSTHHMSIEHNVVLLLDVDAVPSDENSAEGQKKYRSKGPLASSLFLLLDLNLTNRQDQTR